VESWTQYGKCLRRGGGRDQGILLSGKKDSHPFLGLKIEEEEESRKRVELLKMRTKKLNGRQTPWIQITFWGKAKKSD